MPGPVDAGLFRETLGHYPTGVAVVTTVTDRGAPDGMVVGTFSSVSLDPPLIAFFPAADSRSFARLRTAPAFCVNVLASDQEPLCRQIATSREGKFDGVGWRPGSLGSPILDGAVSWIECTFEEVREAGDHFIVLGRVHGLAVERSTLPLLFFQGGYGRFSPGSFVAAPDPELIQAAHLAETIRTQVEELSTEFSVTCSVLARIRDDAVQVLATNTGLAGDAPPLGHRQPVIPPMGAVFMTDATSEEVDEWLSRAPDCDGEIQDRHRALLDKVRVCGYSLLATEPHLLESHRAALSAFEKSDRLPRQERVVQQATAKLAELFCPDLVPGESYDLASIVVLIPTKADLPQMALRMTGLPGSAPAAQVESWIEGLKRVAQSVPAA
ncbi:flavin reductase family protein [Streptomyces sp. SID10853]|uniref:flavin reductase family protein n=1 Tax=Streptomyces sp. SID10853 TaxID=2706028 RepID=UPI0013C1653B|nr:flavin reductase family protein [Streptomyces sp. SID10853]NDZ79300.1 flavin reductase family protein [Streptomyces sp. SID10853]